MRDGRLAPSASSTVTLTVAPRSTGCVSRTTPSAPSKRPAGNCPAEPGRLTHAWYARPVDGTTEAPDQQDRLIAVPDDEHEPSGGGRERHPDRPGACEHGHAALERRLASRNAGTGRAGASSDERPRAEADRGQTGNDGEGGERAQPGRGPVDSVTGVKATGAARGASLRAAACAAALTVGDRSCIRPRISGAPDDTRGRPLPSHPRPLAPQLQQPGRAVGFLPMWPSRSGVQVETTKVPTPVESESFTSMIGARKPARRMLQIGTSR